MTTCSSCGFQLDSSAKACSQCNTPVSRPEASDGQDRTAAGGILLYLGLALRMATLDKSAFRAAGKDSAALPWALMVMALALGAESIGRGQLGGALAHMLVGGSVSIAAYWIGHQVATFLGGRGTFCGYLSMGSLSDIVLWVAIVPGIGRVLGGIASIYWIVMCWYGIREVYALSEGRSVLVMMACLFAAMVGGVAVIICAPSWLSALLFGLQK